MRLITAVFAVLSGVFLLDCAREEQRLPPPSPAKRVTVPPRKSVLAGCYRAEWKPANPFPLYTLAQLRLPAEFELTDIPTEPGGRDFTIKAGTPHDFDLSGWELVNESEARLTWSTGFVGFTIFLSLPAKDGVFEGVGRTFSDVPETPETAEVKLHRISCDTS